MKVFVVFSFLLTAASSIPVLDADVDPTGVAEIKPAPTISVLAKDTKAKDRAESPTNNVITFLTNGVTVTLAAPKPLKRKMRKPKNPGFQPTDDDIKVNVKRTVEHLTPTVSLMSDQSKSADPIATPEAHSNMTSDSEPVASVFAPMKFEDSLEDLPAPAAQDGNYNDDVMQATANNLPEPGVLAALQSWVNMVLSYIGTGGGKELKKIEKMKT